MGSASVSPAVKKAASSEKKKDKWEEGYDGKPKEVEQEFTYPTHTDPRRNLLTTSVYLDDVEREREEILRAKVEDREPDLENPPATQSTPLLPTHVVKSSLPGDHDVKADLTMPVIVGRPQDDK